MALSGEERDLKGQARIIAEVRHMVDAWRGFALGSAEEPYPVDAPRYEPAAESDRQLSETTRRLLLQWFRHEPHVLGRAGAQTSFKYWPHQRRLVETFIYLYEVRGIRRTEQLYELCGVESLGPQRDPWSKLGGQLATGSGKTKMMSLIIAWAYLNAVNEHGNPLGLGQHAILIAPNLFVKDRLLQDFNPPYGDTPVFFSDPVIPPEFDSLWKLKVYEPGNCPLRLDPTEGALVVTNYHQLLRTRDEPEPARAWEQRTLYALFESDDPRRLEDTSTPLIERFRDSRGLLVLNDEAHHVWDETGHAKFEQKAKERAKANEDEQTAMAWIRSIRRLNGSDMAPGRVALQVDLSATLFEEAGSFQKPAKSKSGKEKREFRPTELFRHAAVHYGLAEAIKDGIVKKPVLERVEVRNKKTGEPEPLIRDGQPNAWEKYRNILVTGVERWRKVKDQLEDEGDQRKPILFILCGDKGEAREVANYLTYGEASRDELSGRPVTGFRLEEKDAPLFVDTSDGGSRSTVVEIHIGQKEEKNEDDWERVRQAVNAVDHDEIPKIDSDGRVIKDDNGDPVMTPNPYNVVVSVMMLKEGWDVRNVKVIVPLRPCDSRTLTEQTLGRGLRKMHPPILDDEGAAFLKTEELYVIEHPSFGAILDQIKDIIDEKRSDEIDHAREYVPVLQRSDLGERELHGVRLVRFEGLRETVPDWRKSFDLERVPGLSPRIAWLAEIAETEIQTYLKAALAAAEEEGQRFDIPAVPSYRDFDHIIEEAFAKAILREMRASFQHKNGVKGVVREFLERKTFNLPAGVPLSFDKAMEGGEARIALGNLARGEVIEAVRKALLSPLREAISAEHRATTPIMSERNSKDLTSYQAIKKNVFDHPTRTTFDRVAFDSNDELRAAVLLDKAKDVTGWVYNHRKGVGYNIEYDWQGLKAHYHPDFIARARLGDVFHNFIIEVKGRYDARDRAKAQRGVRYCELLTEHDSEPWHYLLLLENAPVDREDITWWEEQSVTQIEHLWRRHEGLPLFPDAKGDGDASKPALIIVPSVPPHQQYRDAVPVYDLAAAAGGFSEAQAPEVKGWAAVRSSRTLDQRMFVARVMGKSMETAIPSGCWALFRRYPAGEAPSAQALDGRRVVVQLRSTTDVDTGGTYTLKRWRVTKTMPDGGAAEIELRPDNPDFKPMRFRPEDGDIRAVAEFLEVVG